MSITATVILGYGLWAAILVVALTSARAYLILFKSRPANSFLPDGSDVQPSLQRLTRIYANTGESFPLLLPLLVAVATNQTQVTDATAGLFLTARLAQSITHLISAGDKAIRIRYAFFVVQFALSIYWSVTMLWLLL